MVGALHVIKEGGITWGYVLFNYIAKIGGFILKTSWAIGIQLSVDWQILGRGFTLQYETNYWN